MALLDLIFLRTPVSVTTLSNELGVEIDATITEEHTSEAEITDHPVEVGADISDHKRVKPARVRLTGVISNTPLFFDAASGARDRAVNAWQELKRLQASQELLTVATALEQYDDMAIESLSTTRDAPTGNALHFTMALRQIITAESQTVEAPAVETGTPKALGRQPTPPAPAPVTQSLLSKGLSALGIF
jgi:hypothetical protein